MKEKFAKRQSQFYRTRLCEWFLNGHCSHGRHCNWAHSESQMRDRVDLSRTMMCPELSKGACSKANCRFAHHYRELRATTDVFKTSLCTFWLQGKCAAGKDCRFAHGNKELNENDASRTMVVPGIVTAESSRSTSSKVPATARRRKRREALNPLRYISQAPITTFSTSAVKSAAEDSGATNCEKAIDISGLGSKAVDISGVGSKAVDISGVASKAVDISGVNSKAVDISRVASKSVDISGVNSKAVDISRVGLSPPIVASDQKGQQCGVIDTGERKEEGDATTNCGETLSSPCGSVLSVSLASLCFSPSSLDSTPKNKSLWFCSEDSTNRFNECCRVATSTCGTNPVSFPSVSVPSVLSKMKESDPTLSGSFLPTTFASPRKFCDVSDNYEAEDDKSSKAMEKNARHGYDQHPDVQQIEPKSYQQQQLNFSLSKQMSSFPSMSQLPATTTRAFSGTAIPAPPPFQPPRTCSSNHYSPDKSINHTHQSKHNIQNNRALSSQRTYQQQRSPVFSSSFIPPPPPIPVPPSSSSPPPPPLAQKRQSAVLVTRNSLSAAQTSEDSTVHTSSKTGCLHPLSTSTKTATSTVLPAKGSETVVAAFSNLEETTYHNEDQKTFGTGTGILSFGVSPISTAVPSPSCSPSSSPCLSLSLEILHPKRSLLPVAYTLGYNSSTAVNAYSSPSLEYCSQKCSPASLEKGEYFCATSGDDNCQINKPHLDQDKWASTQNSCAARSSGCNNTTNQPENGAQVEQGIMDFVCKNSCGTTKNCYCDYAHNGCKTVQEVPAFSLSLGRNISPFGTSPMVPMTTSVIPPTFASPFINNLAMAFFPTITVEELAAAQKNLRYED